MYKADRHVALTAQSAVNAKWHSKKQIMGLNDRPLLLAIADGANSWGSEPQERIYIEPEPKYLHERTRFGLVQLHAATADSTGRALKQPWAKSTHWTVIIKQKQKHHNNHSWIEQERQPGTALARTWVNERTDDLGQNVEGRKLKVWPTQYVTYNTIWTLDHI